MGERLGQELVPDGLWELVEPLIPPQTERPQGGGTRYVDDRAVFTAVVYVLTTGCAWRTCRRSSECRRRPRTAASWPRGSAVRAVARGRGYDHEQLLTG